MGRKPNIKYFKTLGSECYILKDRDNLGKFDAKFNVGIFLGYSTTSKAKQWLSCYTKKASCLSTQLRKNLGTPFCRKILYLLASTVGKLTST